MFTASIRTTEPALKEGGFSEEKRALEALKHLFQHFSVTFSAWRDQVYFCFLFRQNMPPCLQRSKYSCIVAKSLANVFFIASNRLWTCSLLVHWNSPFLESFQNIWSFEYKAVHFVGSNSLFLHVSLRTGAEPMILWAATSIQCCFQS